MSTNVTIREYLFVCVPSAQADFSGMAAIYVILCVAQDGSWTVLDVGQSGQVGTRIDDHDRRVCWERNCPNGMSGCACIACRAPSIQSSGASSWSLHCAHN